MTRTVFNLENKGHLTKTYPMFFGDSLGINDNVNVVNKRVNDLYHSQVANRWYAEEINMAVDRQDMLRVDKDTADLMVKTIMWQNFTDGMAARSIAALLMPHVTNPEAEGMILAWSEIEYVHSLAYSHIIKQTMPDPDEVLLESYRNLKVAARSRGLIEVFDNVYNMPHDTPLREKKKRMAVLLATIMMMEGVSFMASFAVTFAIAETGVFQGIAESVGLVARDESLHSIMSLELIKACRDVDGWGDIFEEVKPEIQRVYDGIIQSEMEWTEYLFSEGRKVVGLTETTLKDCVKYYAQTCYRVMGLEAPFERIESNPCAYMDKYMDRSLTQYASQEIQHGSYRQASLVDDVEDDLDLDFEI